MAMSNGVTHTKCTTIGAEDFDGQLTEIWKLGSDGIDGTKFRTERLVSAGRRQIALSNRVEYTKYVRIRSRRQAPGDGCMGKLTDWPTWRKYEAAIFRRICQVQRWDGWHPRTGTNRVRKGEMLRRARLAWECQVLRNTDFFFVFIPVQGPEERDSLSSWTRMPLRQQLHTTCLITVSTMALAPCHI